VRRERIASVVTALALVLAAVGGGLGPMSATQPASATSSSEICTLGDLVGLSGLDTAYDCLRNDKDVAPEYENITATDAYSNALGIKDSQDSYLTTSNNFIEDTRTVAYSKGKIRMVNAVNNGTGVSETQNRVNRTVDDYYSQIQLNTIKDWNAKITEMEYIANTSLGYPQHRTDTSSNWANGTISGYDTKQVSLINGSNATVRFIPDMPGSKHPLQEDDVAETDVIALGYASPDTGDISLILDVAKWERYNDRVESQAVQVKDNLAPLAEEVINQYNAGELDSVDLARLDPAVIGQEAATSLDSTGYYGHAAIMLASLGASGNINVSHSVTTGDGTTLNGTVFYTGDDAPETGFETGSTVNTSAYNGTFYMAVAKDDGNASIVNLANYGETFDIDEATNTQTGESVNATKVQTYTYDTTNASALAEEIDRLEELRERYEEQAAASSGVGINLGTEDKAIIGVIAAVVLVLALRD
jgi:hypothetical protein